MSADRLTWEERNALEHPWALDPDGRLARSLIVRGYLEREAGDLFRTKRAYDLLWPVRSANV